MTKNKQRTATRRNKGVRDPECSRLAFLDRERRSGISSRKKSWPHAVIVRDEIPHEPPRWKEAVSMRYSQLAGGSCMKEMLGSGIPTESIKRVGLSSAQELGDGWRNDHTHEMEG